MTLPDGPTTTRSDRRTRRGVLGVVLDLLTSVWFGVTVMVILFLYCSVGSAVPPFRQMPGLEMTEFEWFNWWPFTVLVAVLCVNLTVVTVRRIPLRLVNAGVWTIHTGIIVLVLGSWYYFSTKLEGDAPVIRRRVAIEVPGAAEPAHLVALPGNEIDVAADADVWTLRIQSTNTAWPILSDEHKGEHAYAVSVFVQPPDGEPFIRQLLAGYPQYTEDIIPGQGRAVKAIGKKLVKDDLKLTLELEPQTYFHLQDTWALYVRRLGETVWTQRPIHGLPRYHDRLTSRDQVFFDDPHERGRFRVRPIDLPVPPARAGDVLAGMDVRITGFLRYAELQRRWREGGPRDRLNPRLSVTMLSGSDGDHTRFELFALDPDANRTERGVVRFLWADDPAMLETLPTTSRANLHIEVPASKATLDVPINDRTVVGHDGAFTPVADTGFSFRVANVVDGLAVRGRRISVAMVDVEAPDGTFRRMVADDPASTRDLRGGGRDPHATAGAMTAELDERITMTYTPRTAPLTFVASGDGVVRLVFNTEDRRVFDREVAVGETVDVLPGLRLRVDALTMRTVAEVKPMIVPRSRRRRRDDMAMVQLEVATGTDAQRAWLSFNQYALPSSDYAYRGRLGGYRPELVQLPDGGLAEVLFSRERRALPNPIALEEFKLQTHLGGYTGDALTIMNYVSRLRFLDGGRWTEPVAISVNAPTGYGGYWYFQSNWDKPFGNNPSGGMNFTGLGVGNRNGVYVQLAGCCIAVAGMLFAFYVKPIIRRRRQEQARAKISRDREASAGDGSLGANVDMEVPVAG